jgi:hypothetical protein
MRRQPLPAGEFLEIQIDREIEPALEGSPLFKAAGRIAKHLADIGRGEFYPEPFVRIGQQAERALGHGAFAGVGIGRLVLIAFLRERGE